MDFVEKGEREHRGEETGGTINAIMAAVSREKRAGERRRKGRGRRYSVWGGEGLRGAEGPGRARLPERQCGGSAARGARLWRKGKGQGGPRL